MSSTNLLPAWSSKNSLTDKSITKFIFCESWATSLLFEENLHFISGTFSSTRILLPVGVSFCAVHSISAKSLDFPEPVGPTIAIISDLWRVKVSKPSLFLDLSNPGRIVRLSTVFSSLIPRNSFIVFIYSFKFSVKETLSIAKSSIVSSEKESRNSLIVLVSSLLIWSLFDEKYSSTKGYFSIKSFNRISFTLFIVFT